jgi:hypothetical protein
MDFSKPMLALSRERLAAVHELRHKRHAPSLYEQIHEVLSAPGLVLVCDYTPFDGSPKNITLYMTEQEQ